jgi:hypothetical protein
LSSWTPQSGQKLTSATTADDSLRPNPKTITVSASDTIDSATNEMNDLLAVKRSLANALKVIERMVGERKALIEKLT